MMDRLIGTLAWLVVVGMVGCLALLLVGGRITHVEFEGSPAERADVERVIHSRATGTNMARLARLLTEEVPWIRAARLRFHWPDTVFVDVEREAIVARWGLGEFITTDGKIVEQPEGIDVSRDALPVLRIAHASPTDALAMYHALGDGARTEGLAITALQESRRGDWTVTLSGGLEVMLGKREWRERFKRFLVVYRHELHERAQAIDGIDARYASGVAVAWADGPPAEPVDKTPALDKPQASDARAASDASPTGSL